MELLRLSTAGSVDDGKSTLIGRLLYDSKGVYEDQLASVRHAANGNGNGLDLALLTDGLRAEREQGITIDVAYRYFSTPRRKFIIADTPGHEQYTRNMATGASTANLAVILVDARYGVRPQSRRHAYIAWLLGIPHLVVAVNKMDLVDFREEVFESIRADFSEFAARLHGADLHFIPISALEGDNVVAKSARMPWFDGASLLHHLETVHIASDLNLNDFRFPVQQVSRPHADFRGYAGQIASGVVSVGDPVMALPSGRTSRIQSIVTFDGPLESAFAPMAVTLCLEDELDISRGDMLVHPSNLPQAARRFDATVVWMSEKPLEPGALYLLKQTTSQVKASAAELRGKVDINRLEKVAAGELRLNEIGEVTVETHRPLFFDAYRRNRATGCFILIDPLTNETAGAGMIAEPRPRQTGRVAGPGGFTAGRVTPAERYSRAGHRPAVVWLSGEREAAYRLERALFDRGCLVLAMEGDAETLAERAEALAAAGFIAVCRPDTPFEAPRGAIGTHLTAATELCRLLEEKGILPGMSLSGGEGI
ncbi:MAG: sulfate adenylyltransferase subunit CysN [Bryobacterales bacterium]|nr:sulfate adenylyltransferase subunit CysN [Bryobacterales bacterium]